MCLHLVAKQGHEVDKLVMALWVRATKEEESVDYDRCNVLPFLVYMAHSNHHLFIVCQNLREN